MGDESEFELYDQITEIFTGIPAATIVPVACEVLITAISSLTKSDRQLAIGTVKACLDEHVDMDTPPRMGLAN